jgi:hypothetical protein
MYLPYENSLEHNDRFRSFDNERKITEYNTLYISGTNIYLTINLYHEITGLNQIKQQINCCC